MFSLARERMQSSKLWRIVRRMPKGALLHCHLEAMVDLDWALHEAFATDGVCVQSEARLASPTARATAPFSFTYSQTRARDDVSVWSDDYMPGTPVPINAAAESFPDGGRAGFVEWVRSRSSITAEEHIKHHEGTGEIWRKFISCFPILASLIYYEPIFRKFVRRMCKQLVDDGVCWVEIRSAFNVPYRQTGQEEAGTDFYELCAHLDDEITKFTESDEGEGFWGGRLIWTTIRSFDKRAVVKGNATLCRNHGN